MIMSKSIFTLLLLLGFCAQIGFAQISGLKFNKINNTYQITYDLIGQGNKRLYDVQVIALINGREFTPSVKALNGAWGTAQHVGRNKQITWSYLQEEDIQLPNNASIDFFLKAKETLIPDKKIKTDLYVGGGASAVGGALLALGVTSFFSKDIKEYDQKCDPNSESRLESAFLIDPATEKSDCDECYAAANADFKKGQIFTGLGLVALVGGVYVLLKKPFEDAYNKKHAKELSFAPSINWNSSLSPNSVGFSLKYRLK